MKGQDVLMSSGDDEGSSDWETPQAFFDILDEKLGPFTLDAAATAKNTKCARYYSSRHNALEQPWKVYGLGQASGVTFCNPPYGKGLGKWIEHGYRESVKHKQRVVMLLPARTDTIWYHDIVMPFAGAVYFVRGRVRFKMPGKKNSATFPSIVVVFDRPDTGGPTFGTIEQAHHARRRKVVQEMD